jgi:hypothetical protein
LSSSYAFSSTAGKLPSSIARLPFSISSLDYGDWLVGLELASEPATDRLPFQPVDAAYTSIRETQAGAGR